MSQTPTPNPPERRRRRVRGTGSIPAFLPWRSVWRTRVTIGGRTRDFYGKTAEQAASGRDAYLASGVILRPARQTAEEIFQGWLKQRLKPFGPPRRLSYPSGPCVYAARDRFGAPIYIGSTGVLARRIGDHARLSAWYSSVDFWEWFECKDRAEAFALERDLIAAHNPPMNGLRRLSREEGAA